MQGIDRLVHFLDVREKGLLLLYCLPLSHKHFHLLEGQLYIGPFDNTQTVTDHGFQLRYDRETSDP